MSASGYTPLHDFASKLPVKPKDGLYINDSNLYHGGKLAGWICDYKKIYKWVASLNTVVYARLYLGIPKHEPARTISKAMSEIKYTSWFESLDKIKTEISRSPKTEKPDVKSGELA